MPSSRFVSVAFEVRVGKHDDRVLAFVMAMHARLIDSPVHVLAEGGAGQAHRRALQIPHGGSWDPAEYEGYLRLMGEGFEF